MSRIVVLAPNWLGDTVMSLPALADLRRKFATATIAVAARPAVASLFENVPGIDEIVALADQLRGSTRRREDVKALKAGRFDVAILFPNSFSSAWIVKQAGIRERWGYRGDFRRLLLTRNVRRPARRLHQGAYYQHLVSQLGASNGPLTPSITVSAGDRETGLAFLAREGWNVGMPLVGIAPGAAYGFAKQWPPSRFAALAHLLTCDGMDCVLIGRPTDRDVGRAVMAAFEVLERKAQAASAGKLFDAIGRTTIRQVMGLMTHCTAFVANDSGAAHLAAATGVPVATIFGPTDERFSAPLPATNFQGSHVVLSQQVFCRPCMLRECPIDHRCMTRIEPQPVFDAVVQLVEPRITRRRVAHQ